MNCIVCGRHTEKSDLELGPHCSESHRTTLRQQVERLHAGILAEPAGSTTFCALMALLTSDGEMPRA